MLTDDDIAAVLASATAIDVAVGHLIDEANERGGRDNVTVALIRSKETPKKSGVMAKLLGK